MIIIMLKSVNRLYWRSSDFLFISMKKNSMERKVGNKYPSIVKIPNLVSAMPTLKNNGRSVKINVYLSIRNILSAVPEMSSKVIQRSFSLLIL